MRKLVPAVLAVCLAACGSGGSTVTTARDAASPAALAAVPGDICKQLQEGIEVPVIPIAGTLRVLAFGDFGTGLPAQKNVALGMAKQAPYHFGITLGDNFYPKGINSICDPRWKSQWEDLYSPLKIRVYATLGNHDHWDPQSPKAERDYSSMSQTWCLPQWYYTFVAGPVQFFALDTNPIEKKESSVPKQLAWLKKALAESAAPWKVVYGHHPVYTNGEHGGTAGHLPEIKKQLLPLLSKQAHVYLAGHEHDLQALEPDEDVWFFVSGGGGQVPRPLKSDKCRRWAVGGKNGFTVLEADEETLTMSFFDADGKPVPESIVTLRKGAPDPNCPR